MTGSASSSAERHADVIVIGGGLAGVGCAAMLSESLSVLVLEAESALGYHSTARSAAIFIPSYGGEAIRRLSEASEAYLAAPPAELESPGFLSPRGELLLAYNGDEEAMDALMASANTLEAISPDDASRMVPILRRETIRDACFEPGARDIDVDALLQSWTRLCRKRGGRIVTGKRVTEISRTDGGWRIDTNEGSYRSPTIVNAAGAWADDVGVMAGASPLGLIPCRRSAAILPAPPGHDVGSWPLFGSVREQWYAKPLGGKLMVSPADEDPVDPHDTFADDMVLAEGLHRYEQAVTVPVTRVEHSWAGLRTFARDRVPVAGFDARVEGFFWLAGQGGYGIQTSPALSRISATLVAGESLQAPLAEIADSLSPDRF